MARVKPVKLGNNERMSFGKIEEVLEIPYLIEVQKSSYQWFLNEGLKEVFRDVAEINDYSGNLALNFLDYRLDDTPKYTVNECKERDATYAAPLRVRTQLTNRETGEIKESEVFMGDFPLMTDSGTFVINGAERVIVSQLVRSPGCYYNYEIDKTGKKLFSSMIIPNRGAWLEYETDQNSILYVRIDKNRKLPLTTFVRALGLDTNEKIREVLGEDERLRVTFEKDVSTNREDALLEVYKKLRPGEPFTLDGAQSFIETMFFDFRRYDMSRVGRYKYNKKLSIKNRAPGLTLTRPVADPLTGEILADADTIISRELANLFTDKGVREIFVSAHEGDEDPFELKILSNGMVNIKNFINFDVTDLGINEWVHFETLKQILENNKTEDEIRSAISENLGALIPKSICIDDIYASINYLMGLPYNVGGVDDIDHLGNRRIRSVGELLQNQFRIGFSRMERVVREKMTLQTADLESVTPQTLINIRPVVASIKEFFGSSPLSQFMDQTNPLAELTHKRRLSALGPGGLSRERAGFEVRDVHYSHYGRMCPIETPEGPNIGLINYLATYARINEYGFIETPFRRVDKKTKVVLDEVVYMTADVEDDFVIAQANEPLDEKHRLVAEKVKTRYRDEFLEVPSDQADFMDVSPKMVVSVATAMIPFLENDDANRALMGSNMQRQAVPLLKTEAPIIGTGMEYKVAVDSGVVLLARNAGEVIKVTANHIEIKTKKGEVDLYRLTKFLRSNQGTCINQRPVVEVGQTITKGEVIADGPSTDNGEIALGKNVLIGFMTWEGYNYEDAILINEKIVRDDVFTSIHIEEYEMEARDTKLGAEEITRDIPNIGEDALRDLDERGIVRVGAEVRSGDILVGKVTPKGETELTAEERLLRAIFGEKAREVRDTSLKVPHGEYGTVVDVKVFTRENSSELTPGVNMVVRCYIAQKRKISVGDKMAGRHGNKGVVSRILPAEDMPFLPDGTPLDIVLNPLGVSSRMNLGQVLEVHLSYAAKALGWKVCTPVFDGAHESDIVECLKEASLSPDGKTMLYDGRTGQMFDNPSTVGYMYFLKLHHLVDDKIHARSTGPYSLVTQQPLGGKAQFGGQRFGEMEVWALEAYGAAYTLQEILTVKSDDVVGRVETYESIVKGKNVPKPGVPESFKVLIKELQSLSLDVKVLDADGEEIDLKQRYEDDAMGLNLPEEMKPQRRYDPVELGFDKLEDEDDDGFVSLGDNSDEDISSEIDDIIGVSETQTEPSAENEGTDDGFVELD